MKFKIGDKVRKTRGYKFEGVVISGGTKLDNERILYSVEVPETTVAICGGCGGGTTYYQNGGGMVHIFAEQDLELIES